MTATEHDRALVRHNLAIASVASAATLGLITAASLPTPVQAQPPAPVQQAEPAYEFGGNVYTQNECFEKFFNQDYDYVDSLVLASFWNQESFVEAKLLMGAKMLSFGPDDGDIHIRAARAAALGKKDHELPVWINDGGYTYEDAQVLAQVWGGDVYETKVTMSQLLIGGHENVIAAALRSAQ